MRPVILSSAYAGIGSRETPSNVKDYMLRLAFRLEELGFILRSGAADGADSAFETGVAHAQNKEIYLPWPNFNKHTSLLNKPPAGAYDLAATLHPAWGGLKQPVRALMARNCQQVLGEHLDDPVKFVVCWTPDGCSSAEQRTSKTGGTGLAIALASTRGIPVVNLANPGSVNELKLLMEQIKELNG